MCPPVMPPARNRTRADTQVGPYKSSIPPENWAGTEPRPYSRRMPNAGLRSTGPSQTSSPANQNTWNDRRHQSLPLPSPSQCPLQTQRSARARPSSRRRSGPLAAEAAPRPGGQQALPIEAGSRPGTPVPVPRGKVQEGGTPSWFPPPVAAERTGSFFAAACTRRKIPLTQRRVKPRQPPRGLPRICTLAECKR